MSETSKEIFERCCRLCAEEQEVTIMMFSEQAEAMLLQNKLNKYLLIEPWRPQQIEAGSENINIISRPRRLFPEGQPENINENDYLPKNICLSCCSKLQTVCDFVDATYRAQEVLTARCKMLKLDETNETHFQEDIKQEPLNFDDDAHITQMEISIDPMMVLENSDFPSPIVSEKTCDDVAYLNEGEDVTIKLIRKGSDEAQAEFSVVETPGNEKKKGKPFPCPICRRSFMTDIALKNHSWVHPRDEQQIKQFDCTICNRSFKDRLELVSHMKIHRLKGTCTICGRIFRSEVNLAIHIESHNSPENAYVCKVCGRSYDKISNLKTHSVTHSNERPFKCHMCKASFKRNQDLKFHINQHTGARPYKCPFCDKRFASSGNCYSHRSRMHPGRKLEDSRTKRWVKPRDKPPPPPKIEQTQFINGIRFKYQCNLCNHSFVKRDNYAYHMYQHTGKKPFQCTLCTEQFVTRKGLFLHHEKAHPGEKKHLGLISKNALLN